MNMFVFTALICTAFMMIGGSMASYWLLIMLPIFIPIMKNNDKKISINKILKIFVLLFGGGAVIYLFVQEWIEMSDSYIAFRLNQIMKTIDFLLVNNDSGFKYSSDSSLARLGSVYDVFIDFSTRPIFGLGMGVETSHGGISSFLSEYGLLGMFIWIRIVFVKTRVKRVNAFFFLFWFFVMNLPLKIGNIPYDIYPIVMFEMTCLSFSHAERVVRENVKCSDSGI